MTQKENSRILLGHGSGGKLTAELISKLFLPAFHNRYLAPLGDQATIEINNVRLGFTTDSFVVNPIFFPGGSIGDVAINGTVNDLSVGGAEPLFISAALILEEGFPIAELERVVSDMKSACSKAGVQLVTGDTKVVEKGKGDKVFITTTGIGLIREGVEITPRRVVADDIIILSGPIGLHGISVMSVREGLEFEVAVESDTAPLNILVKEMLDICPDIRWMRDPTRGGLSSALNELAGSAGVGVEINEKKIPVLEPVKASCEVLGLDPLYVANEGILIAVVPRDHAQKVLSVMQKNRYGKDAAIVGKIVPRHEGKVILKTSVGGERIVEMLTGEQLPRIC